MTTRTNEPRARASAPLRNAYRKFPEVRQAVPARQQAAALLPLRAYLLLHEGQRLHGTCSTHAAVGLNL